jgi:glycosyltransferase involved in cell wall biosynthesis
MRVLLVAYFYEAPAGGGIIVARQLRTQLAARGHTVDVLCLAGSPETQPGTIWRLPPPRGTSGQINRLRQVLLFLNNRAFDRYFLSQARALPLREQRYDFILAQDFLSVRLVRELAREWKVPCGATLHDTLPQQVDVGAPNPWVRRLLRGVSLRRDLSLKNDLRDYAWLAAVSRHVQRSAERWLQPTSPPIHVVYNPVPEPFTRLAPPQPDPVLNYLFVGRLSPEKGVDLLVEAFRQTHSPHRLTILGLAGSLGPLIRSLAASDPRIQLHAAVPYSAMPGIYQQHHAVCCPVMWDEPFGLTVLEGRVTQRIVIGTRRGGLPEILEGYPRAQLFDAAPDRAETIQRLSRALAQGAELLRTPIDAVAEGLFLAPLHLNAVADRYEALINAAVAPASAGR